MANALPDKALIGADAPLDEIMLAMDVVDTLRHDQAMLDIDLRNTERKAELIERLREIYANQGIDVPDHILSEGVDALEDERFAYHPPKASFGRSLAKVYINRKRWGLPIVLLAMIVGFAFGVNYFAVELPAKSNAHKLEMALSTDIPKALSTARDNVRAIAKTDAIKARAEGLYEDGILAVNSRDIESARMAEKALTTLVNDLRLGYSIRVVSRTGEYSGVFRIPDANDSIRNYYLIVEAVDADNKVVAVTINSEEDQQTQRTTIWGVRVTEDVFNAIAADKKDDQIIQDAIIGKKVRGVLDHEYSVETAGGYILKW